MHIILICHLHPQIAKARRGGRRGKALLFPALDPESHIFCLLAVGKSITGQCKMENACLIITSWEIPCMNPVSYTQEWWLCSFSTNFLSRLSGQRTNSVLRQKYLECNKLLLKKTTRNCPYSSIAFSWLDCLNKLNVTWLYGCKLQGIRKFVWLYFSFDP